MWDINLKFDINLLQKNTSTKTKTTVLVISMFFVLSLFFVYMQYATTKEFIEESQKAYEKKLNSIFEESIIRVEKFYHNRGLANLNSYGIQEALSKTDSNKLIQLSKNRWKILKHENKFLKSMIFFDQNKNILAHLGETPSNINLSINSIFIETSDNQLNYTITITSSQNNGYLVFMIDPIYFLSEIYHLANIESYIVLDNKNKPIIHLKESQDLSLTNYLKEKEIIYQNYLTLIQIYLQLII